MKRLRDWLELCRIPNVFTAMADPLAGALLVGPGWRELGWIPLLMLASSCLYTGGIVLNDWHDYKQDLFDRPKRPLPSNRIRRQSALAAAMALLSVGVLLTWTAGATTGLVGTFLFMAIVFYDVALKEVPIAPAIMGLCRGLNLLLGMTLVSPESSGVEGGLRAYLVVAMVAYITGVTVFARTETKPGNATRLLAGAGTTSLAVIGLCMLGAFFPAHGGGAGAVLWPAVLLASVGYRMTQALLSPKPELIQSAVKTAILGVVVFDAGVAAFTRGLPVSLIVLVLLVPAVWLGKWMYST